jgi:hypothetical protein
MRGRMGRKTEKHFLITMQEVGAKTQDGGPHPWSYTGELGEYTRSKIMDLGG